MKLQSHMFRAASLPLQSTGLFAPCSFGLSDNSQQYFSLRTNQPPATRQQYFSLRTNQHQPPGKRTSCGLSPLEAALDRVEGYRSHGKENSESIRYFMISPM